MRASLAQGLAEFQLFAYPHLSAKSGLTHTLVTTSGNVSDVTQTHKLLHGDEKMVFGDAGYQGADKRPQNAGKAVDLPHRDEARALKKNPLGRIKEKLEKAKASIRAKVGHPFHVLKNLFRHRKTQYRGLAKNTAQLFTLFGKVAGSMLCGKISGTDTPPHCRITTKFCIFHQLGKP